MEALAINKHERIWQVLADIAEDEGLSVYDVDVANNGQLKIYIQSSGEQGVTSDDCSKLCKRLMVYFTAEGDDLGIGSEPDIEVSSPGINRQLRLPQHFSGAVGENVAIVLTDNTALGGVIKSVEETSFKLGLDGEELVDIELSRVKKARVDFQF